MRKGRASKSILLASISLLIIASASLFPLVSRANQQDHVPVRIAVVEGQANAAFRFIIDGRETARLDAEGLHIRESIDYGGVLTDTGTAYYDATAAAQGATP